MVDTELSFSVTDMDVFDEAVGMAYVLGLSQGMLVDDCCETCSCGRDIEQFETDIPASLGKEILEDDDYVYRLEFTPQHVVADVCR
ncbi:hypothetical protein [Halomonas sp.]|uniref:hypothetical protein n=1 Tax=Halomonas sp. TaxID=1486246 RepID=UPI003567E038